MDRTEQRRTLIPKATIGGVPIHAMLVGFPIVCLVGALIADIAYVNSPQVQWVNFAEWLLAFGTALAVPAAVFGMIDFFSNPRERRPRIGYWHMGLNLLVAALALLNNFVHARDGWTAVMPQGLALSILTVLILAISGHLGGRLAYHHVARISE